MSATTTYVRLAVKIKALLLKYGRELTISRTVRGGATTTVTVRGVFIKRVRHMLGNEIPASGVEIGDWEVMLASTDTSGAALTVRSGDVVVDGADTYSIAFIEPIKPGEVLLGWTTWIRSA